MSAYAKALIAVAAATLTAALAIVPPHTLTWEILTVLAAALGAAAVYLVPNTPSRAPGASP